jgi:hypothetical protein
MTTTLNDELRRLFMGPRLKIERAYRHLDEFHAVSEAFLDSDFYEAGIEEDPNTGACYFKLSMSKAIPAQFPLCMGDAAHNMQAALDHLATGLVRKWRGHSRNVYFPFDETREGLIRRISNDPVKQSVPGIENIIVDEIKPYKAGNTPLWQLNKLDVIDKHNLLIPAIYVTHVTVDRVVVDSSSVIEKCLFSVGPGGLIKPFGWTSKVYFEGDIYPSFNVSFPEGSPFQNEPVLPTLVQAADAVRGALDRIETFLMETGWPDHGGVKPEP